MEQISAKDRSVLHKPAKHHLEYANSEENKIILKNGTYLPKVDATRPPSVCCSPISLMK